MADNDETTRVQTVFTCLFFELLAAPFFYEGGSAVVNGLYGRAIFAYSMGAPWFLFGIAVLFRAQLAPSIQRLVKSGIEVSSNVRWWLGGWCRSSGGKAVSISKAMS
jgi:hypothetical protein